MRKVILIFISISIFVGVLYFSISKYSKEELVLHKVQKDEWDKKQHIPWWRNIVGNSKNVEVDKKIKVAILDSGINKNHKDLEGKVVKEFSSIGSSFSNEDNLGHGTAIAGIITANDNKFGIIGVTQSVEVYSAKVIKDDGKIDKKDFINGLEWAISQNVDVINLSLGFQSDFPELRSLIADALNKGIILIAASGNTYGLNAQFPARYDDVISVGMINEEKESTKFSAIGKIDFVGPGENILSLNNTGGYSYNEGSSYSTAYVTGVVAEYLSRQNLNKDKSIQLKVYEYLKKSSVKVNGDKNTVGYGLPTIQNM
ncbi:S8 family peptidase [Peribacillus simplex]|uniref:S8 family peptidase n=1 Tax=Peribacillus simplex TaxID=1478 RepID=UPI003D2BE0C2